VDELGHLVNDLLLLSSLDAEQFAEAEEAVEIGPLLADLGEAFGMLAEERDLEFSIDVEEGCRVMGRPALLRRLFGNLLDNAIAYTPAGGRVSLTSARDGTVCRVAVTDTGVGLSPADVGRVFDRFYRADASRSRKAGGLGLGLSLCKRIAELAGGSISVESHEGRGSTFTVTLPLSTGG
jgi:signal transduction histidine kinase